MIVLAISNGLRNRGELQAELFCTFCEVMDHTLSIAFLVVVLSLISVFGALGEHRVNQSRQLVGCCGDGLGLVHA